MQSTIRPEAAGWLRRRLLDADPALDSDLRAWQADDAPVPRVAVLRPLGLRASGRPLPVQDAAASLVVLRVLALRPLGLTEAELLRHLASTPGAPVEVPAVAELLDRLAEWLGRDPSSGRTFLRPAGQHPGGVYRLSGVLVDVDLFRRLRLRGAAQHTDSPADLRAARRLLPAEPARAHDLPGCGALAAGGWGAAIADLTAYLAAATAAAPPARPDGTATDRAARDGLLALRGDHSRMAGPSLRAAAPEGRHEFASQAEQSGGGELDGAGAGPDAHGTYARWGSVADAGSWCWSGCLGVWLLPTLGQVGGRQCTLHGGDLDAAGQLLPLRELQQRLSAALSQPQPTAAPPRSTVNTRPRQVEGATLSGPSAPAGVRPPSRPREAYRGADRDAATSGIPSGGGSPVVAVLAAHGGAGASTLALALADAAAAAGSTVDLVSLRAGGFGLEAVADAELGTDAAGWRIGRRGTRVTVRRLDGHGDGSPHNYQPGRAATASGLTVLDVPTGAATACPDAATLLVVVARASVPGLRAADELLGKLAATGSSSPSVPASCPPGLVAVVVGPVRWPGPVRASLPGRVDQLQRHGRVLTVPLDAALGWFGPTAGPLPRPVVTAARRVLGQVPADPGHATLLAEAPAQRAAGAADVAGGRW